MSTRFRAGERISIVRQLAGFTRPAFADYCGFNFIRLSNIEKLFAKVHEEDFLLLHEHVPELIPFLVHEQAIDVAALRSSKSDLCRLIAAQIVAGRKPKKFDLSGLVDYGGE